MTAECVTDAMAGCLIVLQVRAICVLIAYHSKLEVSSLSGDFKNAHRSPAVTLEQPESSRTSDELKAHPIVKTRAT